MKTRLETLTLLLTLVNLTTAISNRKFLKLWHSQAKKGKCPKVVSAGFDELQHLGRWYLTYTTMPFSLKCVKSEVAPVTSGAIVYTKAWFKDGTIQEFTLPGKMKRLYPGMFVSQAKVGDESTKIQVAITTKDNDTKLVWVCGNSHGGRKYTEYAEVYSRKFHTPTRIVDQFAQFLGQHGSKLNSIHKVSSETCPRIIHSANKGIKVGKTGELKTPN